MIKISTHRLHTIQVTNCNGLDRKKKLFINDENDWGIKNAAAGLRRRRESQAPSDDAQVGRRVCVCVRERRERVEGRGEADPDCDSSSQARDGERDATTLVPFRVPDLGESV